MKRIGRHLSYANATATLALVFAMTGGAVAASGGFSSSDTLRACANEEGVIRLLKAGKKCRKGQTIVTWNQTGPAGAPGGKGATGASGAVGAPGAAGTPGQKGVEGPKGTSGDSTNVKWASVDDDGFLVAAHGAVAAAESGNHVTVAFDQDITKCAIVATQNGTNSPLEIGAERAGTEVRVTIREGSTFIATDFSVVAYC